MPKTSHSRHGSLQFWPRKRAKRQHARVRSFGSTKGTPAFAGFKAGMTHIIITDNSKNAPTKGQEISVPVTIIECPPLRVAGMRFYHNNKNGYGEAAATEVRFKPTKALERVKSWKQSGSLDAVKKEDYTRAALIVHTQPGMTAIGQKTPQIFEIPFNGAIDEAIAFVKEHQELPVETMLKAGQFVDVHGVTTGKGTQGVVKRFGVSLKSHKSEKGTRKAVIAAEGAAKVQFTAPMAGKMGYHLRTEYNKQIIAITQPEDVQISGGIVNFGQVKNTVLLIKGSVSGPKRRLVTLVAATRPISTRSTQAPAVSYIHTGSQQGNQ